MSKRDLSSIGSLAIVIMETKQRNGRFEARLDGDDRVLCVSRTPFFDAARELVANGYDPNLTLIMRHAGSDTDSLTAKLGTAASLTLEETDYGPKLRRWKPFSTLAVAPRNAPANRGKKARRPSAAPLAAGPGRSGAGGLSAHRQSRSAARRQGRLSCREALRPRCRHPGGIVAVASFGRERSGRAAGNGDHGHLSANEVGEERG
jgi:hypothetical protein